MKLEHSSMVSSKYFNFKFFCEKIQNHKYYHSEHQI